MSLSRSVMVPNGNLLRICTGRRRASSVSQRRVSERLENMPLVSITGWSTRQLTSRPSGSPIFSRFTTSMVTGFFAFRK